MSKIYQWVAVSFLVLGLMTAQAQESTVTLGLNADARSLDPVLTLDATTIRVIRHIYDPLFFRADDMSIQPELAESYEWDEGLTWIINLRQGVTFHNGEPFNAEAVKYTLDFILDPENNALTQSLIDRVAEVEVIDDYTVQITTSEPFPTLRENLSEVFIAPPQLASEQGMQHLTENPIGTGPFMLERWNRDEQIVLVKNPDYFKGEPEIDRVVIRVMPDVNSRVAALMAGEVDLIPDVPPQSVDFVNNSGMAEVKGVPGRRIVFIAFDNISEGPAQDVRVRQAVNYGVDVDEIIETIMEGHATRTPGPLLAINSNFDPSLEPYPYDPERARALLEEAGYADGLTMTLHSPDGRYLKDREFAQAIASQLGLIGVNTQVRTHEWGTYLDMVGALQVDDMHVLGRSDRELEGGIMYAWFRTGGSWVTFSDPEIDRALDEAVEIVNPEERQAAFDDLQRKIQEAAPWIFLWGQHDLYGVSNRLNWEPRADEQFYLFDASLR